MLGFGRLPLQHDQGQRCGGGDEPPAARRYDYPSVGLVRNLPLARLQQPHVPKSVAKYSHSNLYYLFID